MFKLRNFALAGIALLASASLAIAEVPTQFINAQTGATYTFSQQDCSKVVTFNSAVAVAVTLPQAGTAGRFFAGCFIDVANIGLGTVTITPTTSTINSFSSLAVPPGNGVRIESNSTNFIAVSLGASGGSGGGTFTNGRNLLRNGAINLSSYGTGTVTGATTGGSSATTYASDGWWIDTNVTSGTGTGQVITATPSPPVGFTNSLKVYRASAALTQPVCTWQEIPSSKVVALQGQNVVFSYYAQALAGLSADNGNVIGVNIITGTSADEGMGTLTASPAITPAFTGLATVQAVTQTITTGWVRYSTAPITIATTVKEVAVSICFTPTATGAGTTDGFAVTGIQFEQGTVPTPYEYLAPELEKSIANQYYFAVADGVATLRFPATCTETTANTTSACTFILPTTMRKAPAIAVTTAASFGITKTADGTAATCTTLAVTASSATVSSFGLSCAATQTAAVGTMGQLIGAASGATNLISAFADY